MPLSKAIQELIQWIVCRPELWDIDSGEAMAAAVPVRDAIFRGRAPQEPGIYFLMTDDGGFRYVGKATYIRDRIVDHFRRGKQFTHCWWIEMPRPAAELVEGYLIRHHKFPLNRVRSYTVQPDAVRALAAAIDASIESPNDYRLESRINTQSHQPKLEVKGNFSEHT